MFSTIGKVFGKVVSIEREKHNNDAVLYKKQITMNNRDIKQSYLQAFLQKKDIFLQKLVLDCLFPENFLTLTIERKKTQQ